MAVWPLAQRKRPPGRVKDPVSSKPIETESQRDRNPVAFLKGKRRQRFLWSAQIYHGNDEGPAPMGLDWLTGRPPELGLAPPGLPANAAAQRLGRARNAPQSPGLSECPIKPGNDWDSRPSTRDCPLSHWPLVASLNELIEPERRIR
jgi:hypothetical protein